MELADLGTRLTDFDVAYLVTVGDAGRAHVLSVWPELGASGLVVEGCGRHSQENAAMHPNVTLVWPPMSAGGYSLIVDGSASLDGSTVTVAPTKAILHRPAAGPDGRRAGSDCLEI
ncbi:MAG: pyridoxamine 5'-phosphate oxidase family protein [Ilumatobacteraceae bacterium]